MDAVVLNRVSAAQRPARHDAIGTSAPTCDIGGGLRRVVATSRRNRTTLLDVELLCSDYVEQINALLFM